MPAVVIKKIIRIQREFLWGGVKGGKKISWVSWKEVCRPRSEGGLGVRDVAKVNLSLLIKWRWRLLQSGYAFWKEVLVAKYGIMARFKVHWIGHALPNRVSLWWKDICGIDIREDGSWFARNMCRKLGNGNSTRFWLDRWIGSLPLSDQFPRLFSLSLNQQGMVREFRDVRGGEDGWVMRWRRRLFVWEEELLQRLQDLLPVDVPWSEAEDRWSWRLEEDGSFSVSSMYWYLGSVFSQASSFNAQELWVFGKIWKSPVPSKVIAFTWKLLRNRIPTRCNLASRGIQLIGGLDCVHCVGREESGTHLFMFCDFAGQIWNAIFRWLGLVLVIPPNFFLLFECFTGAAANKKIRKGYALIWHTTIWMLWKSRNDIMFSNGVIDVEKVIDDIKLLSWRWGLSRHSIPVCLFYEWCWDPGLCLQR
ncbi:hypothetical protein TSUD_163120 [Trifolium subterraneum]|uniref:Reverse transcriptase zinc-binding domain-containing protein n=1 Tax=Trifolium subterraneum TaxID=3900 RepID=A0A2Z6NDI7_TRISU|nr:hypothetical protein TSUD_163120 [Trifolium subterraneum]